MTSAARAGASRREGWLDALRVMAAFGVIVNHTNSKVFQALTPVSYTHLTLPTTPYV